MYIYLYICQMEPLLHKYKHLYMYPNGTTSTYIYKWMPFAEAMYIHKYAYKNEYIYVYIYAYIKHLSRYIHNMHVRRGCPLQHLHMNTYAY